MDLVGRYIGNRYEILEKIGNGGMATVYKAKCHVLNRFVAVKVLKDEYTTDEEFIKRFNIEAQAAASLTHPNIVSIYDVGHEFQGNIYYIVMELIQGKTLKEIIDEDGALPWKWSVNIASQIASALEVAHKNNIVHRDIKPHNIIITEDGVAKVTDFGIAKAVSNSTITAFGTTLGSVHYFSPEHARGGYTDAKSDLYSLGVVMYEMVTGRVPFDADTPVSIALKHMQEKPVDPMRLNPSIPLAVNQIIMKAMQKDPNSRYQSATEMLKDLNLAIKNPEGEFVEEKPQDFGATKRMNTITEDMLEEEKAPKKKQSKIGKFFKEHPKTKVAVIILACILIFAITMLSVKLVMDISTGKNVQIPELTGKTKEEVEALLKDTKFQVTYTEEYSDTVEAGKVISQEPPYRANYTIKENAQISYIISKGTEMTIVPKVAGKEYSEAEKDITDAKLKVEKIEETSEKVEEGYVIKQEPEENTQIKAGETVKVYVSIGTGIEVVSVPYVIGSTEEAAKKALEDLKLKAVVVYEEDKSKTEGTVLKQSLDVGKEVDEGTTVTITVNKFAEEKTGTVNINLKSLLNYEEPEETNSTSGEKVPEVKVRVEVDGETIYNETKPKNTTKINLSVSGVGTVQVRVYVDDVWKNNGNSSLDLNSTNPVLTIE